MGQKYFKSHEILDDASRTAELSTYAWIADGGDSTVTGFFVDIEDQQIGVSVTGTIPAASACTLGEALGAPIPSGAVGFRGTLSVHVYEGRGGKPADADNANGFVDPTIAADMIASAAQYPLVAATTNWKIGRAR